MVIDTTGLEVGEHTLILQSFDESSTVGSTLKTDSITLVITEGNINQEILQAFSETPIKIRATAGELDQKFYLTDLIKDLESTLGVADLHAEPSLDISLQKESELLALDSLAISVTPASNLEAAVYKDASLIISIYDQQVSIPIEVTITACTPDVRFEPAKVTVEYILGSGPKPVQFPSLTKVPACELEFSAFKANYFGSGLASEVIAQAVKLAEDGKSLTVDTMDIAFLGQKVAVIVDLSEFDMQRVGRAEQLEVEITFVDESSSQATINDASAEDYSTKPLLFDMSDYTIPRITCSDEDTDWVLKLPPLLDLSGEEDDVQISLLSTSWEALFQFRA